MWQQEQYERRQRDSCEHSQHRPEKVGPPDAYSFSPTSVQLSKGSALGIENKTDEDHSIACKPDAGVGTTKIAENETKSVMFSTTGTFTCSSTEHPEATLSVTVK